MTLVAKTSHDVFKGAFTLLEMMVTLSLIALLASFAFVSYKPDSASEKMKKATVEVEALAARGHTMSVLHQQPFRLRFERHQVVLQGGALEEVKTTFEEDEWGDERNLRVSKEQALIVDYGTFSIPEGMQVSVRRWGAREDEWFHQEKKEDPVIYWNFEQTGLCEPISIQFKMDKSWVEVEMDPLTGRVADEWSEIYD